MPLNLDILRTNILSSLEVISALLLLFWGAVVYLNDRKNAVNVSFALLCLVLAGHCFSVYLVDCAVDQPTAFWWARTAYFFLVFIIPAFLGFIATFLKYQHKKELLLGLSLMSLAFLWSLFFTNYFLDVVRPNDGFYLLYYRYKVDVGAAYMLYGLLFLISILVVFWLLSRARRGASGIKQTQILYLMNAIVIGGILGVLGMGSLLFKETAPLAFFLPYIGASIFSLLVGYAIIRHRLMDISFIIRKGLVYSLVIGCFTGLYIFGLLLFGQFIQGVTGRTYVYFSLLSVIVFSIAFQPLKNQIQLRIDRLFFKEKYNYQKTLKQLSQAAVSVIKLDSLLELIGGNVTDGMKLENASIMILNKGGKSYETRFLCDERRGEHVDRD
jgi:hypothetical protein